MEASAVVGTPTWAVKVGWTLGAVTIPTPAAPESGVLLHAAGPALKPAAALEAGRL